MANNTANVSTTKGVLGGYFYVAPYGTACPTDNTTSLSGSFVCIGYISDAGVTHSKSGTATYFHDLNMDVIESATSEIERTMQQKFVEVSKAALEQARGFGNVTESGNMITAVDNNDEMPYVSIVQELVLKDSRKWRRVIPKAKVTEWGDEADLSTDLAGFELTYTKFADDNGGYQYDYIDSVTIDSLGALTVASTAGSASGTTALTVTGHTPTGSEHYVYKTASGTAPSIGYGELADYTWTGWNGSSDIAATTGHMITVAIVDASGHATWAGSTTVTSKA